MKSLGKNIKRLRLSRGLTQPQLADIVGAKTYTTISKWESGANAPQGKDLIILSEYFNVSVDSLLGIKNKSDSTITSSKYRYLPTPISAGLPITVDGITETEKISIPDTLMGKWAGQKDIFITKIFGDSMNKTMPDGSLIAVKPVPLNLLKDGDIVVYSVDHDYSVKRLIKQDDKLVFRPHSTELCFTDQIVNIENNGLIVHGKVVLYIVEMD